MSFLIHYYSPRNVFLRSSIHFSLHFHSPPHSGCFILFCCDPSFSTRGHKCLITATDSPAPAHIQWNSLVPHRVILHWANMRDATKITVINKVHFCTSLATCFGFKYQAIIMPMYLYILTLYHSACKRLVMETINSRVFLTSYSMWYK